MSRQMIATMAFFFSSVVAGTSYKFDFLINLQTGRKEAYCKEEKKCSRPMRWQEAGGKRVTWRVVLTSYSLDIVYTGLLSDACVITLNLVCDSLSSSVFLPLTLSYVTLSVARWTVWSQFTTCLWESLWREETSSWLLFLYLFFMASCLPLFGHKVVRRQKSLASLDWKTWMKDMEGKHGGIFLCLVSLHCIDRGSFSGRKEEKAIKSIMSLFLLWRGKNLQTL